MPLIRIHSDVKVPERVVIDTNQPQRALAEDTIVAGALGDGPSTADAVQDRVSLGAVSDNDDRPKTPRKIRLRESLAQAPADPSEAHQSATTESHRTSSRARRTKLQRFATRPDDRPF